MKKIILLLAVSSFLFSCSGNDDGNSCGKLLGFNITQENEKLNITLTSDGTSEPLYYELSYQQSGIGDNPDNGQRITLNSLSESIAFTDFLVPDNPMFFL
ncbi:hypothetical protein [Flavobacterium sp. 3HN19-14]|uniref:hypothetical protein n=1 Tax=Flavobacterium sp. 3HN19-14 TaxID=3448133 RepID=UPI003EDEB8BB